MTSQISKSMIRERAMECVAAMGDIFWDAHSYPRIDGDEPYADPTSTAIAEVEKALEGVAIGVGAELTD